MNKWEKWDIGITISEYVYVTSSCFNSKGVSFVLQSEDEKVITISFTTGYITHRETGEGCFENTLFDIHTYLEENNIEKSSFLKAINSDYIKWVSNQFSTTENIHHYMIITYDVILEILSTSKPSMEISNAPSLS